MEQEQFFCRDLQVLEHVFAFFDGFAAAVGTGLPDAFPLRLAVEEVFVNMVTHNAGGDGAIGIALAKEPDRLTAALRDPDSEPYDITKHKAIGVGGALEDRPLGGLGLHLVNHLLDEVRYEYRGRETTVCLAQRLPP